MSARKLYTARDVATGAATENAAALMIGIPMRRGTGTCWDCKHYDREEEECLIIKRWFGDDIPGGHDSWDFCSKIERRENDENN